MNETGAFSPRRIGVLIVAGVLAFFGAAYFAATVPDRITSGNNSFSVSSVGHKAFVELLQRRDIPVVVSRFNSTEKAARNAVLVLAEPFVEHDAAIFGYRLAPVTLLILPKWLSEPDADDPAWIGWAGLVPDNYVAEKLQQFLPDASLIRTDQDLQWDLSSPGLDDILRRSSGLDRSEGLRDLPQSAPVIGSPQFIRSPSLTPILSGPQGMLVGAQLVGSDVLFVISDPDLISNSGIGRGDNAAWALKLIALMRPKDGTLVFDETIHDFRLDPNFWRLFFEMPFAVVTVLAMISVAILSWAAVGRFGAPRHEKPADGAGKLGLIDSSVDLLMQAGHEREMARSYSAVVRREISQRLHIPGRLTIDQHLDWIDRIGAARGARGSYRTLDQFIDAAVTLKSTSDARLLLAVQQLYDWKQEVLNESGRGKNP